MFSDDVEKIEQQKVSYYRYYWFINIVTLSTFTLDAAEVMLLWEVT